MKKLVIISGITGAIGNALLSTFTKDSDTVIYGISRMAFPLERFIEVSSGSLYPKTFIASIGELEKKNFVKFSSLIARGVFRSISYIHAVGLYPFEINQNGEHQIENDNDGDGIDDQVLKLTYYFFSDMVKVLANKAKEEKIPFNALIFGGIADMHKPIVHESWWKTIEKTKDFMKKIAERGTMMNVLNISSVICAHEVINRPFVFLKTDADARYWLTPEEIARKVHKLLEVCKVGFFETDFYHKSPYYNNEYYKDHKFTPRKVNELY